MASPEPSSSISGAARTKYPRWLPLYFGILIAIVVVRFETIDLPPYYDYAMGLWTEADFLATTGFDYYALRYENDHAFEKQGGARSYMTSLLPTILAAMMWLTPTPRASIIAYHLFIFACSSGVLTALYMLVRSACSRTCSALVVLAAATTPIFAVQIDMTSMEMPLILAALLTTIAVWNQRFNWAVLASTVAFFMKPTGSIFTIAIATYLALRWCIVPLPDSRRASQNGLLLALASLAFQAGVLYWGDCFHHLVHPVTGSFLTLSLYWFPDLLLLLALTALLIAARVAWAVSRTASPSTTSPASQLRDLLHFTVERQNAVLYSAIVIVGVLLAVNVVFFIPRYFAVIVPFLYLLLALLAWPWPRLRLVLMLGLSFIIVFNLANWNGRFYISPLDLQVRLHGSDLGRLMARECSHFERSHEYLAEHRSTIKAMRLLDGTHNHIPVVAGHPHNHYLALPSLGYVQQPPPGYSTLPFKNTQGTFAEIFQLLDHPPRQLIFVWAANGFYAMHADFNLDLPTARDRLLYDDRLPSPLLVYQRDFVGTDDDVRRELLTHFWPRSPFRAGHRLVQLYRHGFQAAAADRLSLPPFQTFPPLAHLPAQAAFLARSGQTEAARATLLHFLQSSAPGQPTPLQQLLDVEPTYQYHPARELAPPTDLLSTNRDEHFQHALELLDHDQFAQAGWLFFAATTDQLPELPTLLQTLRAGITALDRGQPDDAYRHFAVARDQLPPLAAPHHWLGLTCVQLGRHDEAIDHFRAAVRCAPSNPQLHRDLGVALAKTHQWAPAVDSFRQALSLDAHAPLLQLYLTQAERALAASHTKPL